jgi:hypothetical protein
MGVGRLEVGDGADGWASSVRERGERRGTGAGGPAWAESSAGRGGEEELGRGEGRWAGLDRFSFFVFFQNLLNHTFKPFLNQIFTQLFTNYFTIILRLLKPHHSQNSCIQIMMHKHLLLLNY